MDDLSGLNLAISGGIFVAAGAAGLFFHRFWRASRERLFLWLALAFWLLSLERVILVAATSGFGPGEESRHWVYLVRLAAFLLIVWGILEKNRPPPRSRR